MAFVYLPNVDKPGCMCVNTLHIVCVTKIKGCDKQCVATIIDIGPHKVNLPFDELCLILERTSHP